MAAKSKSLPMLLLLGAGESGKATLSKQLRFLFQCDSPSAEESESFRRSELVESYCLSFSNAVIDFAELQRIEWPLELHPLIEFLKKANSSFTVQWNFEVFSALVAVSRSQLFLDLAYRLLFHSINALGKVDQSSCTTFFHYAQRYWGTDIPPRSLPQISYDSEDVVCARVRTTGIVESSIRIAVTPATGQRQTDQIGWSVVLTGGQRSERKKWSHLWSSENLAVVFHLVSLNYFNPPY